MGRIIDADSHFMEPLDLWERYIEPPYRSRCLRFARNPQSGRHVMLINEGLARRLFPGWKCGRVMERFRQRRARRS